MHKNKIVWAPAAEGTPPAVTPPAADPPATEPTLPAEPPAEPSLISGTTEPPNTDFAPLEDLTIPEGFEVNDEQRAALLDIFNAPTRKEMMEKALTAYADAQKSAALQQAETWNTVQTKWQEEMRTAFAGETLGPALATAKETALRLGGPEFLKLLDLTGAGNNVHMLRALTKAAELIPKEGTPVSGAPAAQPKSLTEKLYPSS